MKKHQFPKCLEVKREIKIFSLWLPGFQFIQDRVEYETRTHHSNMDNIDRIQPGDLIEASAIVATFIYHAANRDEPLPRKPLPAPQPLEKPEQ